MAKTFLFLSLLIAGSACLAADDPVAAAAERFAYIQTQGLPGEVSISVGTASAAGQLPPCSRHEAFLPAGARLWGKSTVGVRCVSPNAWSVMIPVHVRVKAAYVTTAKPLVAGQTVQATDLVVATGDLTTLPTGILTDPQGVIGKTLKNSLGAGQPLRADQLQAPLVIRQGQTVRLVSRGEGFAVSSEGKAINNAAEGQVAQIRMPSGQVVSGIARPDGSAEISN